MPTGGLDVAAGSFLAGTLGETAAGVLGTAALGAETGAALGGLGSLVTGGNVGQGIIHGAEGGALTGGGIGLGGLAGGALGATEGSAGMIAADALGGAAGGALGGVATHTNPLIGAAEGAVSGGISGSGILNSNGTPSTTQAAPAGGGAGVSAAGGAAPAGVTPDIGLPTQDLSTVGSAATSGTNVGSGTTGTSSLPNGIGGGNLGSQFAQAAGGAPTLSSPGIDTLAAGGGVAGGAAEAASAPSSVSQFLSHPSLSNAGNIITSNPGAAISAAGLGLDALKGNQALTGEKQLKSEAATLANQGNQLQGYLQSGTLPPGLQQGIDQASEAAKATIRSQYASRGMSGSSAEQQDLAAVDQRAQAQGAEMAMQLLQSGISETGMSSQLYQALLQNATTQDTNLSSAIAGFASAAAGGDPSGKKTITIG